ncbi:hypothetical protein GOV12_06530 [Candidatus Pacearchaeota archaeon]|nr:hypothetical protein [Candidatus Pacearchaeota archaeon]
MQKKKETKSRKKIINNLKKVENSRLSLKKILFLIVILLLVVFVILSIYEFGIFDYLLNLNKEPQLISIKDECSLYLGRVIHKIKSLGDCSIACNHECNLRELNFHNINFVNNTDNCNVCNCYCK